MTSGGERLPDQAKLGFFLVEAPLKTVESLFRGIVLEIKRNMIEVQGEPDKPYSMLREDRARIGEPFDYAFQYDVDRERFLRKPQWYQNLFPLRGIFRLSRVRSNLELVLVEFEGLGGTWPLFDLNISIVSGAVVYKFSSTTRYTIYDSSPSYDPPRIPSQPVAFNSMSLVRPDGLVRSITAGKQNGKSFFRQYGDPLPFENPDHYKKRIKTERFNRNILCDYLEALGVDPEATFDRRELDDPVLFTIDPDGELLDPYVEDLERWRASEQQRQILGAKLIGIGHS
ncbi:hypothetical protein OM960_18570 [Defluviimonas sp. CAU 1641]|uniref:Uncharacterized protein n=1 Tax=Defluviimonas salinarum TaxID=2992147 RepID=A0ABT3J787_9RHOB|nr:hypothetical protein [Defluviimonas salinarum]